MDVSELTEDDLKIAKLSIEYSDILMTSGPSDSGWISYEEDESRIVLIEHEKIERQPGLEHGGDALGEVIEKFDEEEILQECERQSIDI
ncbi:hypothetical protein [Natronobacterium texcoconense]|uniref:hypothetical protein n=1 Tax=Natronobacterium texcoconense TaxID=1095778 RepID=UPI00111350EE|nr:hypothetical protein [Natronobacterium texcoconense]